MTILRAVAAVLTAAVLAALSAPAATAQDWPTRTIRIIVGFSAGGGTDLAARIIAPALQDILGVPVVVENKPSAGGIVGGDQVAKGQKDGYTLLMMSNAHAVSAAMYKQLPYDPIGDFQMLSLVGTAGLVMITAPDFPAGDVKGTIDLLKSDPNKFNYGSAGVGTTQHFAAELFNQMAGLKITHIPYRSTPCGGNGADFEGCPLCVRADPGGVGADPRRHAQGHRGDLAPALSVARGGPHDRRGRSARL